MILFSLHLQELYDALGLTRFNLTHEMIEQATIFDLSD